MKGYILAAGNGTRLLPLTNSVPKCLVPIQGTPMLGIWLQWCRLHGIDDVVINLHAHADMVRAYLMANSFGVRTEIAYEPELLGSAGTLRANRSLVRNETEFVIMYGDVLTNMELAPMLALHRTVCGSATIGLHHVLNPTQCGIVELDSDKRVVSFEEKPVSPKSTLAFSGVLIGTPAMLDEIPDISPVDIGFHTLPRLINRMYGYETPVDRYLRDIGTMQKYEAAQTEWPGFKSTVTEVGD